jgi:S-adenosylmethionine synthetase
MSMKLETGTTIELYLLEDWDGGDGRGNRRNGIVTTSSSLAKQWKNKNAGASYDVINGTIINSLDDIEIALENEERRKALAKLTDRERRLLGLE